MIKYVGFLVWLYSKSTGREPAGFIYVNLSALENQSPILKPSSDTLHLSLNMNQKTLARLHAKKQQVKNYLRQHPDFAQNMHERLKVELTYASNAIEGNTLSRQETALVLEKGIAVPGKKLRELTEATNHAEALERVLAHEKNHTQISEADILNIHQHILKGIDDKNAGVYRRAPVRILGSKTVLPNALKVPQLMSELIRRLQQTDQPPERVAAELHYKLVTIHPFIDGNGRTARLLFNRVLLSAGYPVTVIAPEDRLTYLKVSEQAQTGGNSEPYYLFMRKAIEKSLDLCLKQAPMTTTATPKPERRLQIGVLAKQCGEPVSSIRFRTQEGLLPVAAYSPGGYALYHPECIEKVKQIRRLQTDERLTISEIKLRLQ